MFWGRQRDQERQGGYRNVQRLRGGLVFNDHRLVYHSTLGVRVIKKRRREANSEDVIFEEYIMMDHVLHYTTKA